MKSRSKLFKSVLLLTGLVIQSCPADAVAMKTLLCNGCSEEEAYFLYTQRGGDTRWLVQDNVSRILRMYEIKQQGLISPPLQMPLPPDIAEYWSLAMEFYDKNGGSLSLVYPVRLVDGNAPSSLKRGFSAAPDHPVDGKPAHIVFSDADSTIWNLSMGGYYQDRVGRALAEQKSASEGGFSARVAEAVGMGLGRFKSLFGMDNPDSIRASLVGLGFYVDVQTVDGGSIRYGWDTVKHRFVAVPDTAFDAEGNRVPVTIEAVAGKGGNLYYFPSTPAGINGMYQFADRLHMLGVPIQIFKTPVTIACSNVEGGPPRCSRH